MRFETTSEGRQTSRAYPDTLCRLLVVALDPASEAGRGELSNATPSGLWHLLPREEHDVWTTMSERLWWFVLADRRCSYRGGGSESRGGLGQIMEPWRIAASTL